MCLFLFIATATAYWSVRNHEFVNYDDGLYVTKNRNVQAGLTWDGIKWAFTTTHASNWHPLTWLSHMLDYEIYGPKPGGHHLSSLLFHAANTLLLFLVLSKMTGAPWRSGFVAALFGLHPLHVESVAWVAERKDVLSTFFWLLTMWTYARYAERPGLSRYLLVLLFFAFGLMSTPMLVTLPFVMLLLDYWPLNRLRPGHGDEDSVQTQSLFITSGKESPTLHLILEKVPFLVLAGIASVVTLFAQQHGGALRSLESVSADVRIANALVSYVNYIIKMAWPQELAVLYPHPGNTLPMWKAWGAALLLVCVSFLVFRARRTRPYLPVGWLWYLGTLVPVIGLVQVGGHAVADRYSYVPLIGLFVIISWGMADLGGRVRCGRFVLATSAATLLLAFTARTWFQVGHWQNSMALFKRTLDVTSDNYVAHNNLGLALAEHGDLEEAIAHYSFAMHINPNYAKAYNNMGVALAEQGKLKKAAAGYSEALRINQDYEDAHYNLGNALAEHGNLKEAIAHYSEALRIKPDFAKAHINLAKALASQGKLREAIAHYYEALRIEPDNATAHGNLGAALADQGELDQAIVHFSKALRIAPDDAKAHHNMGIALARLGKMDEAIAHYSEAIRITPNDSKVHSNLGAALVDQGRLEEAISHYSKVLEITPDDADTHFNLGHALAQQGRYKQAIRHFSEALRINPGDTEARENLRAFERAIESKAVSTAPKGQ